MYVDPNVALVCMPKCATTFARYTLHHYRGGWHQSPRVHVPARDMARTLASIVTRPDVARTPHTARTVYGCVRDPWSWYASVYYYTRERYGERGRRLLQQWTGEADPTFAECVTAWTSLDHHYRRPGDEEEMLYPGGVEMPGGAGLWSCSMRWYYGAGLEDVDGWVRVWRIAEDLAELCDTTAADIAARRAMNAGEHPDVWDLYDEGTWTAVAESDGPLFAEVPGSSDAMD